MALAKRNVIKTEMAVIAVAVGPGTLLWALLTRFLRLLQLLRFFRQFLRYCLQVPRGF